MTESKGDTGEQRVQQTDAAKPSAHITSDEGVVWVRFAPSQVVRTIVIALLTAAVVLGALYLLWQIRTFIGWCVLALLLAVVLNPAIDWLQRRRVPRTLGIVLTYLGMVAALILIAGDLRAPSGQRAQQSDQLHSYRGSRPDGDDGIPQK